jgi:hypothetical protein
MTQLLELLSTGSSAAQVLSTAQGRRFKASLFTLPRIWAQIQVRVCSELLGHHTIAQPPISFAEIQCALLSRETRLQGG